jgi:hypothetical protein
LQLRVLYVKYDKMETSAGFPHPLHMYDIKKLETWQKMVARIIENISFNIVV